MKAHLHKEFKLWSFVVLCQSQSRMQGGKREESNMKNSRGWKLLDTFRVLLGVHFIHTICLSNLGKSGVQRFKWCANRRWNKEVMAVWRQPRKAKRISLRNTPLAHEFHFATPPPHFAAAKWAAKWPEKIFLGYKMAAKSPFCHKITSKLRFKLQIIFKLRNHLQVAKPKFKLAKWIIQHVNQRA